MAGPSDTEQWLLEEINFARMNPLGDAARYLSSYAPLTASAANIQSALKFFNVSGAALLAAYQQLTPAQPVAWNENLASGARGHNAAMIAADDQTHQAAGEADLGARATAAGYSWRALGENIYAYAYDALYAHAGFMVDWGDGPDGMQADAGHRVNIMNPAYREVGVAVAAENDPNTDVGPLVVTEDFGNRLTNLGPIILGVAFNDADHNRFYSLGEGRGDLTASLQGGGPGVTSWASGGYTLQAAAAGAATVNFSGGGLSSTVSAAVTLTAGANVKLDVVSGSELWSSTSAQVSGPVSKIVGEGLTGLNLSYVGASSVTFVGTAGADRLTGSSGFDRADYSAATSGIVVSLATGAATGGGGGDTLASIEGLIGSGFDDLLVGSAGPNSLDGGGGNDTSLYAGLYRAYAVSASGGNETVAGGPEGGTDSLTSIEKLKFVDGYFDTGTADPAAQVFRIYQAALGRAPDQAGLTGWVQALTAGAGLQTIGDGFLGSPEFIGFGAGTASQFVTLLYNNVLHRAPDSQGLQNWVTAINSGQSRSAVLTGFSESAEFINGTAPQVQQGLWVGDANAAKVARLYDATLDRLPDAVGEAQWTTALQNGQSLQAVADGFVRSTEFQAMYGALDNSHFVQQLYLNVLGRPADQGGLDNWTSYIASGHSRAEVVIGLSESAEHVSLTAPYIDNGVWFA